jgi:hypothetical protein
MSNASRSATATRWATIGLLTILAIQGLRTQWNEARTVTGLDFYQFWVGAKMARTVTDFYAPATRQRVGAQYLALAQRSGSQVQLLAAQSRPYLDTLSTPLLYVVAAVFDGPYERALRSFQVAMLACLVLTFFVFARTFRVDAIVALALFVIVTLAFRAERTETGVVNINHLLLLLVALGTALAARKQFFAAGALLVLTTLFKPNILPVYPMLLAVLLLQKRTRALLAAVAGGVVAGLVGYLASAWTFADPRIWNEWLVAFRTMPASLIAMENGNFALSRILLERTGVDLSPILLTLFFGVLVFFAWRTRTDPQLPAAAPALGCLVFVLGSPLVWPQYYLLTLPIVLWLLRSLDHTRAAITLLAVFILAMDPWHGPVHPSEVLRLALVCNAGLLLLATATAHALWRVTPEDVDVDRPQATGSPA